MDHDPGHESATVQTLSRTLTSANEAPRGSDTALPAAQHGKSEFALPASLLVPALLVGLQVEPATGWPLQRRSEPERPRNGRNGEREREAPADEGGEQEPPGGDDPPPRPAHGGAGPQRRADELVFEHDDGGEWCETLSRALREALAARVVPQALLAAAEQWRRGRCVVLACPQGADPAGPGWAFVLWPRPADDGRVPANPLALFGLRVAARLQWQTLPPTAPWCHVRVVKEHHPRRGRQLVLPESEPGAAAANAVVACEVQLGPVLARSLRWCEVRVHIQAAQRFWAALGRQWSVHVVVCARPLVAARTATKKASPC
jgi:hypothetical protein